MCALVQAIRKCGIVASAPGIGNVANPMYIVRTSSSEIAHSSPSDTDDVTLFGQSRRIVEDPTTQVDDDRQPQSGFGYYNAAALDRQEAGATGSDEDDVRREAGIDRGTSFGRRRKQVQVDLEKGPQ